MIRQCVSGFSDIWFEMLMHSKRSARALELKVRTLRSDLPFSARGGREGKMWCSFVAPLYVSLQPRALSIYCNSTAPWGVIVGVSGWRAALPLPSQGENKAGLTS